MQPRAVEAERSGSRRARVSQATHQTPAFFLIHAPPHRRHGKRGESIAPWGWLRGADTAASAAGLARKALHAGTAQSAASAAARNCILAIGLLGAHELEFFALHGRGLREGAEDRTGRVRVLTPPRLRLSACRVRLCPPAPGVQRHDQSLCRVRLQVCAAGKAQEGWEANGGQGD